MDTIRDVQRERQRETDGQADGKIAHICRCGLFHSTILQLCVNVYFVCCMCAMFFVLVSAVAVAASIA